MLHSLLGTTSSLHDRSLVSEVARLLEKRCMSAPHLTCAYRATDLRHPPLKGSVNMLEQRHAEQQEHKHTRITQGNTTLR